MGNACEKYIADFFFLLRWGEKPEDGLFATSSQLNLLFLVTVCWVIVSHLEPATDFKFMEETLQRYGESIYFSCLSRHPRVVYADRVGYYSSKRSKPICA